MVVIKASTVGIQAASEFMQWTSKLKRVSSQLRPKTVLASLQNCDKNVYPIVYALLTIGVVIPVSTATPERSFSALKTAEDQPAQSNK